MNRAAKRGTGVPTATGGAKARTETPVEAFYLPVTPAAQKNSTTGMGGVSLPVLSALQQNSIGWHQAKTPAEKAAFERKNTALRAAHGLEFDPKTGQSFAGKVDLSLPVRMLYGSPETKKATGSKMAKLAAGQNPDLLLPTREQKHAKILELSGEQTQKFAKDTQDKDKTAFYRKQLDELIAKEEQRIRDVRGRSLGNRGVSWRERSESAVESDTLIELRKARDMLDESLKGRVWQGAKSIGNTVVGSVAMIGDTMRARAQDVDTDRQSSTFSALEKERDTLETFLTAHGFDAPDQFYSNGGMSDAQYRDFVNTDTLPEGERFRAVRSYAQKQKRLSEVRDLLHDKSTAGKREASNAAHQTLLEQAEALKSELLRLEWVKPKETDTAYEKKWNDMLAEYKAVMQQVENTPLQYAVDPESFGARTLTKAQQQRENALQGLAGATKAAADLGLSIGQNAAMLPLAAINPALPAVAMGAVASGQEMHALNERGKQSGELLSRGFLAGGIEAATEKIPIEQVLNMVKTGGKGLFRNLLKQFGVEATEEGASYALNVLADKAAGDPDAAFSVQELLYEAAAGGISGLVMAGAGTAVHGVGNQLNSGFTAAKPPVPEGFMELPTDVSRSRSLVDENGILRYGLDAPQAVGGEAQKNSPAEAEPVKTATTRKEDTARYVAQIDGVFTGAIPDGQKIVLGKTPGILQEYGAIALDLTMTQKTARKIAYPEGYLGGKHNLGIPALKQLPTQISNPIAILKSKTQADSLIVLTEWVDAHGDPVITPIHLNKNGSIEIENQLVSAYGKPRIQAMLGENNENVLYTKNNESINQLLSSRLQLPSAMADDPLVAFSIARSAGKGKTQNHKIFLPGVGAEYGLRDAQSGGTIEALQPKEGAEYDGLRQEDTAGAGGGRGVSSSADADTGAVGGVHQATAADAGGTSGVGSASEAMGSRDGRMEEGARRVRREVTRHTYDYHKAAQVSEELRAIQQEFADYGIAAEIADGSAGVRLDGQAVDMQGGAITIGDGSVLIDSNTSQTDLLRQIRAHETVHVAQKNHPVVYQKALVEVKAIGLDITVNTDVLDQVQETYSQVHGKSPSMDKTLEELLAQIAGWHKVDPDFTREKFGNLFFDFDAVLSILDELDAGVRGAAQARTQTQTATDEKWLDDALTSDPSVQAAPESKGAPDYSRFRENRLGEEAGTEVKNLLDEIDYEVQETVVPEAVATKIEKVRGAYGKDFSRVLDGAAGGNTLLREQLREIFERPLWQAKSAYAHRVKDTLSSYHKTMKELGIKQGSRADAAVMWYGEGQRTLENGDVTPFTEQNLRELFPASYANIQKASAENRRLYDEYLTRINQTLSQIYPHVEEQAQRQLDKYRARAAALSSEVRALDQKKAVGAADAADTAARQRLMEDLQETEKAAIRLQRDVESGEVFRGKRLRARKDFYHHFQEMQEGFAALKNILTTSADIDPHLVGTSDTTKPKTKWQGFMQQRNSTDTVQSSIGALLDYIPAAEYKINIDPQTARLRVAVRDLMDATADANTTNANSFIEYLTDFTNDLAGKTNPFDRAVQKAVGRKALKVVEWINSRVKANAILGNLQSATSQWFNFPNVVAYIKNPLDLAKGTTDYLRYVSGDKGVRTELAKSGFITERFLDDRFAQFDENLLHKPKEFATWLLTFGDKQTAQVAWLSAHAQGIRTKQPHPVEYADDIVRRSVAGRGIGEVPLLQQSKLVKLVAPFQVEVNNAYQLIKERVGQKDALGLILLFLSTYLMNEGKEALTGSRTGMDLIDAGKDALEAVTADEYEGGTLDTVRDVSGRLAGEFISNMPYGAQIASTVIGDETSRQKLFGDSDPTRFGTGNIGLQALADPLVSFVNGRTVDPLEPVANLIFPWGGKQVMRTKAQLEDMGLLPTFRMDNKNGFTTKTHAAPGAYAEDGTQVKFPLDTAKAGSMAKGLLFGRYATDDGKQYLAEGARAMSENNTAIYESMVSQHGAPARVTFDTMREIAAAQPIKNAEGEMIKQGTKVKQELLFATDGLTQEQKQALDRAMISTGEDAKPADYTDRDSFLISIYVPEEKQEDARAAIASGVAADQYITALDALREAKKPKGVKDSAARAQVLASLEKDNGLTDGEKNVLIDRVLIADLGDTRREDWAQTYKGTLLPAQFVEIASKYAEIAEQYKGYEGNYSAARMSATDFAQYVDGLALAPLVSAAVKGDFSYFNRMPADPIPYQWDMLEGEAAKKYAPKLAETGLDITVYNEIVNGCKGFLADKDAQGKSISGSKKEKVIRYIREQDALTTQQQNLILQAMGYKLGGTSKSTGSRKSGGSGGGKSGGASSGLKPLKPLKQLDSFQGLPVF